MKDDLLAVPEPVSALSSWYLVLMGAPEEATWM